MDARPYACCTPSKLNGIYAVIKIRHSNSSFQIYKLRAIFNYGQIEIERETESVWASCQNTRTQNVKLFSITSSCWFIYSIKEREKIRKYKKIKINLNDYWKKESTVNYRTKTKHAIEGKIVFIRIETGDRFSGKNFDFGFSLKLYVI